MNRFIALLVIAALTSACASQPKQVELTKIPDDTKVLLDVQQAESELPNASSDSGTYAKHVGGGALAGAGMGAVAGFSMGIVCGPAILICGPIGAIGGAMGGTVFGIGFGTFSAASLQLPQEKSEALDAIIAETVESLDMTEELAVSFRSAGETRWSFVDENADTDVSIVLNGIGLQKQKKNHVTISMSTTLVVQTGTGDAKKIEKREFNTHSRSLPIDHWIGNDGDNFRDEIKYQLVRNSEQMFASLRAPTIRRLEPVNPSAPDNDPAAIEAVAFVGPPQ